MNEHSSEIGGNASELGPSILDASVFSSRSHCETLINAREEFFLSDTLYRLLYRQYDREKVFNTLKQFMFRPWGYLPDEKFEMQPYLTPYKSKMGYVEEVYPYYEKSLLPQEVKDIILDEYSFLKEHSSVLMSTRRLAQHLHRWGIILLDASNKSYDWKHSHLAKVRGPKWIVGILLVSAGAVSLPAVPVIGAIIAGGGVTLALFDP